MSKDSFQFYRSFFQTIDALPIEMQRDLYRAIALYGLNEEEMELGSVEQAIWFSFKAQLDANWRRYYNGCKNTTGSGGAPKGNQNARKQQQAKSKTTPKQHRDNTETTPNTNRNINTNVNTNTKIDVVVVDDSAREKFKTEVATATIKRQQMCYNLRITDSEFDQFAHEVFNEWEIIDAQGWDWAHFTNTMRIKVNAAKQQRPKNSAQDDKRQRELDVARQYQQIINS